MILESLVRYYEALAEKGVLSKPGWSQVDVSYALDIDINGKLKRIISLKKQDGKKLVPQKMSVPSQIKRSSGIAPNFLCDNSSYLLGIDGKGKPDRARDCFLAAKELHEKILPRDDAAAIAVLSFFENWNVEKASECEVIQELKNDILKGGNLIFMHDGKFVHENKYIKEKWNEVYNGGIKENECRCSVTGKIDSLAILHPTIKRIRNAQSSGASLVSFNATAFSSFGKEQGYNAQTGEYASFAYGEALNYLTERLTYKNYLGNTALLFYAINGEQEYQDAFNAFFFGDDEYYSKEDLIKLVESICEGKVVDYNSKRLDPQMEFYLLGVAPNNARLSIRFFERGTFGEFVSNIREHQERLNIESGKETAEIMPTWQLLQETCRSGADVSPILAGELTRSIIENVRYPATLINAIDLRIRADHHVGQRRAAIIKAYYLKNENKQVPKEVLTVGLNKETDNVPYNLGRLFAVLERIQESANPGLNSTIKDKYFGGASATPATIMPKLIDLSQNHLRKLNTGMKVYYSKQLGEILEKFEEGYPKTLNMPERGAFQLGYYHQIQDYFKSKKVEGEK
ncbi:type I-C CRISPR-associated protein Cas8c/Csd1 [Oribacterium sp. FC2011]|uniref:type I-C CRISPR-associated protein Cas8c/Csd1 n=1 Tax=Oribacterium sp. FC2011 TaxID=1408311 RepID=UPI0004E178ED|nr:type I-C CRISPR-associated protein Cas8c/Csd1 [Oribacterium sp. FC2011]